MNATLKIKLAMQEEKRQRFFHITIRLPITCDTEEMVQEYIHTWKFANPDLANIVCGFDWIRVVYL